MMRLGYVIVYVDSVIDTVAFYESAFGLKRRFVHESGAYAELETGDTALAFASRAMARANLPEGVADARLDGPPAPLQITLTDDDVASAYARALEAGSTAVSPPATKPWGQVVAYVRAREGTLVELATPMHAAPPGPRHILTILAVADLAVSRAFYEQAFGWEVRVDVPVFVEFALPDGRGLGLYQRESFGLNTNQAPAVLADGAISGTELYLHCDDLSAQIAKLEAAGARLLSERAMRDWGDHAAYYADVDGNVLVVATPAD